MGRSTVVSVRPAVRVYGRTRLASVAGGGGSGLSIAAHDCFTRAGELAGTTARRRQPVRQGPPSRIRSGRYRTTSRPVWPDASRRRPASAAGSRSAFPPPTAAPGRHRTVARRRWPGWPGRTPPRPTGRPGRAADARWRRSAGRPRTPAPHVTPRARHGRSSTPASPASCRVTGATARAERASSFVIRSLICLAGVRPSGPHAAEVAADGSADRFGVRGLVPAGTKSAVRCYPVVLVGPAVRCTVDAVAGRLGGCAAGYQSRAGFTHRQTRFGMRGDRHVLHLGGSRPAAVPHRLPVQVGAVRQLVRVDQPLGEHSLVDQILGFGWLA